MAARKKPDELLVARQTVTPKVDGEPYALLAGVTRVPASHPVAKAHPALFEPVERHPEAPERR